MNKMLNACGLVTTGYSQILDKDESIIPLKLQDEFESNHRNLIKEREAINEFNKVFGFLKNQDIADEYVKVRLKVSKLSSNHRNLLLAYVEIRKQNDIKFKECFENIDNLIEAKIKELKNEGTNNS